MKRILAGCLTVASAVAVQLVMPTMASADDTFITGGPSRSVVEPTSTGPNRYLLRSGLFTLGASYVPALVVAIESDVEADNHLFAPVVGPWLDLAARDECTDECNGETINKVLLASGGVFQGLGPCRSWARSFTPKHGVSPSAATPPLCP